MDFSIIDMKIEVLKLNEPTINRRIYPLSLGEKIVDELSEKIKDRRLLIFDRTNTDINKHMHHSDDMFDYSNPSLSDAIGYVEKIYIEDCVLWVEAQYLKMEDNRGEFVFNKLKHGKAKLAIAGMGTTVEDEGFYQVVQPDFMLTSLFVRDLHTAKISFKEVHDSDGWHELAADLGYTEEQTSKIFKYGEFGNLTIEVDENLNIVGGKIHPYKKLD